MEASLVERMSRGASHVVRWIRAFVRVWGGKGTLGKSSVPAWDCLQLPSELGSGQTVLAAWREPSEGFSHVWPLGKLGSQT